MILLLCSQLILINDIIVSVTCYSLQFSTVNCHGLSLTFIVFQSNARMDPSLVRKMSLRN